ncbi:cell division protein DedD [Photobacterium leiognathi]|uniref:cell division protein DedD n=1 Tax=Photobacterium leiognathi TaxID=553611 RepID=UPI00298191F6|nr:cell division protein DedD [Photobacterium leiognathi]
MASQFQNRLIGTIILVTVGVIFLPDLFDGQKQHYKEQFASIPLQPKVGDQKEQAQIPDPETANTELPKEPVTVTVDNGKETVSSSHADDDETYTVEEDKTAQPAKPVAPVEQPKPVVKPQPKPAEKPAPKPATVSNSDLKNSGWMIQLGTFGNFKNASALVAKLRLNGYQAHLLPKNAQPGQYVKVVVGPDLSKDKLLAKIDDLKKLTGLSGKLYQFNPIKP